MPVLGIESSAHTLGIGIVDSGMILANEKRMYRIGNAGILPMRAAELHTKNLHAALGSALSKSGLGIRDIEAVGYTKGPGLGPCLEVGMLAARGLAQRYGMPIFHVNHAVAHIEITSHMCKARDPLVLYVSGGNSQILAIVDEPNKHYHVYGETFDIGVGNMLDSFARNAGFKRAWGSEVASAALGGDYISMPYTVKGMDFAFTGLMTHAMEMLKGHSLKDVAYSLQETAFSMLCEATERALLLTGKRTLIVCGGVAQSTRLQEMLKLISAEHRARFGVAPNEFNADNGAMVALVAEKLLRSGVKHRLEDCNVNQKYRIDKVALEWL
jgi:glycoprotease/Kae1 family metallohydrolase